MADKSRNFSAFLLVLALIGAALFYGCGSSEHSDDLPGIAYTITGKYTSEGLSDLTASARASAGPAVGVLIYSENDPNNYADIDTVNHTFELKNLRPGSHYIIFKHIPNGIYGDTYITRSKEIVLTPELPVKQCSELKATKATCSLTGKLLDSNGRVITPAPIITVWGQNIEVNPVTGEFETPKMPDGVTADLIIKSNNYKSTATPVEFKENPTCYEITAVEVGSNNLPPTVNLTSKNSRYNIKSVVTLTATASDPNNDQLVFDWSIESCTSKDKGSLELFKESSSSSIYYWNAPDTDCMATISVKVYEKNTPQQLSAKAKLKLQIGTGIYHENTVPEFVSTDIFPSILKGDRNYTITAIATDTDGDTLYYDLKINALSGTNTTGTLEKKSANTWAWRTPYLEDTANFAMNFEVKDKKNHVATLTRSVAVGKTEPNDPPQIISKTPSEDIDVMSDVEVTFIVNAKDPEYGKLSFAWSCDDGEITSTSFKGDTASATWKAPVINVASDTKVTVLIYDQEQSVTETSFIVHVVPDPNKKAPEININITNTDVVYYKSTIPLFKPGETVEFEGFATDLNKHELINPIHYTWSIVTPDKNSREIARQIASTSYVIDANSQRGDYSVTMTSFDIDNKIKGTGKFNFRVNTLPEAEIQCNGVLISDNGRMSTPTQHSYKYGEKEYDVFQKNEVIELTSSCKDEETDIAYLESKSTWSLLNTVQTGKTFIPPMNVGSLTTVMLTTSDSKQEKSATSTYSFYVNDAPVFATATSTSAGFIDSDSINLKVLVNDDYEGLELSWYCSTKPTDSSEWSAYTLFEAPGYNPTNSTTKQLESNIKVTSRILMDRFFGGKGGDVRIKLIATDSMGIAVENNNIKFSIVDPHLVTKLTVAKGGYNKALDQNFDSLQVIEPPYIFAVSEKFSVQATTDKWEGNMTYKWYDYWLDEDGNIRPDSRKSITDSEYLDGKYLNGIYEVAQFGTHTIRLEAIDNTYNIVASKSFDFFINSVPQVKFADAKEGDILRFDADVPAKFNITLTEDNTEERLGLVWTFVPLNEDLTEDTSKKITKFSHDLDSGTGSLSPVSMGGAHSTTITVSTEDIEGLSIASGAMRVYVCAFDEWDAAATATIDVLFNTLPVFADVVGQPAGTQLAIKVPTTGDNDEDYQFFVDPYTMIGSAPVFLVDKSTMYLDFEINASDSEANIAGLNMNTYNAGQNIVWKFSKGAIVNQENRSYGTNYSRQGARFGIGKNTVAAEIRDTFYNRYNGKFNSLAVASMTRDFYIWESTYMNLPDSHYATALYKVDDQGCFYVQFGKVATYTQAFQIIENNQLLNGPLSPGYLTSDMPTYSYDSESDSYIVSSTVSAQLGKQVNIIALMPHPGSTVFTLLTDLQNSPSRLPSEFLRYFSTNGTGDPDKEYYSSIVGSYTMIRVEPFNANVDDDYVKNIRQGSTDAELPNGDAAFFNKVISVAGTDNTSAMLLKGWNGKTGTIAPYSYTVWSTLPEHNNPPLFFIDGKELQFDAGEDTNHIYYSKLRWMDNFRNFNQKLYLTDTGNDRVIRLNTDFSNANSLPVFKPIDVAQSKENYLFTLSKAVEDVNDGAVNLFKVSDSKFEKACEPFGKLVSDSDPNRNNASYRAGKFKNPRSFYYYALEQGENCLGGLVVLEDGTGTKKNRIQIIRTNMPDWIE